MAKKIQLYIDGQSNSGDFVQIDLFEDEPIKIVDSIQNVTDINKIYDTFSRDFKVPASPNNNKVFKGFANPKIINGFDSRIVAGSIIKINGQDFKKGRLRLLSVGRKNNGKASFYKLSFQGNITTIKERLNGKKVKDLNFDTLRIPSTNANKLAGIRDGLYARGQGAPVSQVSAITITSKPSVSGNCRIRLNGVYYNVPVSNDSKTNNAIDIATYVNNLTGYTAQTTRNIVIIGSTGTSLETETEFNAYFATGMEAVVTTPQWGGALGDEAELDENGIALYPDVIYAPIFTNGKIVAVPTVGSYVQGSEYNGADKPTTTNYDFTLNKFTGYGSNNTSDKQEDSDTDFVVTPVSPDDYRPSVKVGRLIRMISQDFGIPFKNEFLHMEEIDQLYMFFNGKTVDATGDNSGDAFNNNASTEQSQIEDGTFTKTYTTELSPTSNSQTFTGISSDFSFTPSSDFNGFDQLKASTIKLDVVTDNVSAPVSVTLRKYFYNWSGTKIILKAETFQNVSSAEDIILPIGVESQFNSTYFFNYIQGREVHYEATIEYSQPISTNNYKFNIVHRLFLYTSGGITYYNSYLSLDTDVITEEVINIQGFSPDIKCIDLLTGIFKMFNLTAYVDETNEIVVKKLYDYYSEGNTIDITDSVLTDNDEAESLGFKYKSVNMKFQEAEDVLTKNYNPITSSTKFGDVAIAKSDFIDEEEGFSSESIGGSFSVELPFQSMMFEQLSLSFKQNQAATGGIFSTTAGGLPTDMVIGNCIDSDLNKVDTKPILFYGKQIDQLANYSSTSSTANKITNLAGRVYTSPVAYTEHGNTAGKIGRSIGGRGYVVMRGLDEGIPATNQYGLGTTSIYRDGSTQTGDDNPEKWWNPSGIMASRFRRDGVTPINYNNHFTSCRFNNDTYDESEFSNEYPSQGFINGLYQSNYEDYLKNMFLKNARLNKFKVKLKNNVLSQYKLNDTFIIQDTAYTINKIEIDILTGEGTVELLSKLDLPTGTPIYDANA